MNAIPVPNVVASPGSRAEALRRALLDSVARPEDEPAIQVRVGRWSESLGPRDDFQSWLVGQVAELSFRVDRCGRSERRLRDRASLRAEVCWDDDRSREAEAIGVKLAARPIEVVGQLRGTASGCDWLLRRWALLARAADVAGCWTEDQRGLAFDLLGTPAEFRAGLPGETIDRQGRVLDNAEDPAAVARNQIAGLSERRDRLAGVEEVDRALVMAGLFDDPCPEIRRLRRHEAALQRRIRWCLDQLHQDPPDSPSLPEVQPDWIPKAPPTPRPVARPSVPWLDPLPVESPEDEFDEAAFLESRRELRQQVADLFREEGRRPGQPGA